MQSSNILEIENVLFYSVALFGALLQSVPVLYIFFTNFFFIKDLESSQEILKLLNFSESPHEISVLRYLPHSWMTCQGRKCHIQRCSRKNYCQAIKGTSLMFSPSHVGRMRKIEYFLDLENLTWKKNIFQLIFFLNILLKKGLEKVSLVFLKCALKLFHKFSIWFIFVDLGEIISVREDENRCFPYVSCAIPKFELSWFF